VHEYEVAVLFDPGLEVDLEKPMAKVEKIITDNGGKIKKTDNWGKKKLAYTIKKQDHAVYVFYIAEIPAQGVRKIESVLNITDEVLRYLIVKVDHKSIAKAEAIREDKAKKAAARGDSPDSERSADDKDEE
jgi:small subunit ribosomal protein S6